MGQLFIATTLFGIALVSPWLDPFIYTDSAAKRQRRAGTAPAPLSTSRCRSDENCIRKGL